MNTSESNEPPAQTAKREPIGIAIAEQRPPAASTHPKALSDHTAGLAFGRHQHHDPDNDERDGKDKADHGQNHQSNDEQNHRNHQKHNTDGSTRKAFLFARIRIHVVTLVQRLGVIVFFPQTSCLQKTICPLSLQSIPHQQFPSPLGSNAVATRDTNPKQFVFSTPVYVVWIENR